jgi:hypothetical protein
VKVGCVSVCILACLVSSVFALAQVDGQQLPSPAPTAPVPRLILIRGTVRDETGQPLTASTGITFTLYKERMIGLRAGRKTRTCNWTPPAAIACCLDNDEVKKQVDAVVEPVERNYESVIRQLCDKNVVGIVVAVNREIVWADIFASTQLLQKYWPKPVPMLPRPW